MRKLFIAGLLASTLSPLAFSETALSISPRIGTQGIGLELTTPVNEQLNLRGGVYGLNYGKDFEDDKGNYSGDLKLFNIAALLDYYPSGKGLRLSAGVVYNGNKFQLNARPVAGQIEIDGDMYSTADVRSANATIDFNKVAPYLGLGGGNSMDAGWNFQWDVGVIYQGKPKTEITADIANPGVAAAVQSSINREKARLQDETDGFRFYPVINLGVSYRF